MQQVRDIFERRAPPRLSRRPVRHDTAIDIGHAQIVGTRRIVGENVLAAFRQQARERAAAAAEIDDAARIDDAFRGLDAGAPAGKRGFDAGRTAPAGILGVPNRTGLLPGSVGRKCARDRSGWALRSRRLRCIPAPGARAVPPAHGSGRRVRARNGRPTHW
jgi:hypothetical protein